MTIGRIIGVRPIGCGHRGIVFLDAALHLGEQLLLQRRRVGHHRFVIGVLALEEVADVLRQQRGIVHHLLPVVGLQPVIVVALLVAVPGFDARALFGPRRLQLRCWSWSQALSGLKSRATPFMQ